MDYPTRVVFNSPETVEALRFVQDAIWKHRIAPSYTAIIEGISFDSGKIAMDVDGSWMPAGRRFITDFKWDMANLPMRAGKSRRTSAYFAGYCVSKTTKNPDLAYAFAKYFQEDEGQNILSGLGLITVINQQIASSPEILNGPGFPEHHALRVSSISYATNGYANLRNWQEMIERVLQPYFDDLFANNITPEECAQRVHADLDKLLAESR
jgi:multiple sugar transport system substrate-binding protein